MIPLILAALLAFPLPPLGATLGSGTPYHNIIADTASMTTTLPATGLATYYSPGVFEKVIKNQLRYGNIQPDACPDCVGYAALLWPADVGRVVCVNGYGPLLVVDNASNAHRPGLIARGWIVDIQWEVWQELGFPNAPTLITVAECS